jgi:hypothetical protein
LSTDILDHPIFVVGHEKPTTSMLFLTGNCGRILARWGDCKEFFIY